MTHFASGSRAIRRGRSLRPVLALDLGGTLLRTALVLPSGAVVARRTARTPHSDAQAVVAACVELLGDTRAAATAEQPGLSPVALGVSAPGPLDPASGVLIDPPNLHGSLWGFPLAETLSRALGLPVVVERDTQVAALAEGHFGAAREVADYVYLTVSTGVGGAVVSNGRLLRGPDGVAGELGHLTVDLDGPPCGCGGRGHLEAIASGTAIAAAARASLNAGAAAADSPLAQLARLATESSQPLEARHVAQAEDEGDPVAARIMDRARDAFAASVVSIVNVFNPSLVVVGGGIAAAQADRLLGPARERVTAQAFRTQADRVEIVAAALGDDVGLVGTVLLVALADLKSSASGSGQMGLHTPAQVGDDLSIKRNSPHGDDSVVEAHHRQTAAAR